MLATLLVTHPWLTTVSLLGLVVLGPVLGAWIEDRRRVGQVLLAAALLVVVVLTLYPTDRQLTVGCTVEWAWPTLGAVEYVANVILFVPLTLLAGVFTRRPWLSALIASLGSLIIETLQALTPALGRSCSTNDWWANTLGAIVGSVLAMVALGLARWWRSRRRGLP